MGESNKDNMPPGMRINIYGDLEPIELGTENWIKRWEKNNTGFHSDKVRETLKRHIDRLVKGRENIKIFVPLCGKSVDIKWLADLGHTVVGIECCENAIESFFQEHNLEYKVEELTRVLGKLFQSTDGKIKLYKMDLFEFTRAEEGIFDGIWDKNSFTAINKAEREKYCQTMLPLMSEECSYLLDVIAYNPAKFLGPPHDTTREDIERLFGEWCSIEELESVASLTERFKSHGMDWCTNSIYLLKLKQK